MSSNVTSKPTVKPLKGTVSGNEGVFDGILTANGLEIPGLFEDNTIFNIVIEDSVINNTIIGGEFPSIATFTQVTVAGDVFFIDGSGGTGVYWDSENNVFNVNTDLVVTGCSQLGNLEICEND